MITNASTNTATVSKQGGYILFYVLVILTLFSAFGLTVLISTVRDLETSGRELATVKARFAAEAAAECAGFWMAKARDGIAHTATCKSTTYTDAAETLIAETDIGVNPCHEYTAEWEIRFANGTCAIAHADMVKHPADDRYCSVVARVDGYSGACAANTSEVERSYVFGL